MTNTEYLMDKFVRFNPSYMCRHLNMECQKLDQNTLAIIKIIKFTYFTILSCPALPALTSVWAGSVCTCATIETWNARNQTNGTLIHVCKTLQRNIFFIWV